MASLADPAPDPPLSIFRYAVGVVITVFAVLSQYFVPQLWAGARLLYDNIPGDLLIVYGIPIVAFLLLVGVDPLRHWRANLAVATEEGLGWFGITALLALLIVLFLAIAYAILDPSVLALLNRPNPALVQAQGDPWLYIAFSFAVGAIEETIFRGWIFGFWHRRGGSWLLPAVWTSAVFAGVHLYYGTTYGLASPLIFPSLFLVGFALAATYRFSDGNLVIPALLHGQMDATAFLSIISGPLALAIHYLVVFAGAAVAVVAYLRSDRNDPPNGPIGALARWLAPPASAPAPPARIPG
ncbi:MAG: CPBP family intramembrane glutamic endopeptidase [Thermoplasmata archaeon]